MTAARFTPLRLATVCAALAGALLLLVLLALACGDQPLSLREALRDPTSLDGTLLWRLRLPRVLLAILVGASLSACGAVLQALLRNPLAEPYVLGVSGGAALGATLALASGLAVVGGVFSETGWLGRFSAPGVAAFLGAFVATLLIAGSSGAGGRPGAVTLLLTGVIFNAFAGAAITSIQALVSPETGRDIFLWLAGTLGHPSYGTLALAGGAQAVALGVMLGLSGRLNLLSLGDEEAAALGVEVGRTRALLLLATSASVGGAVALSGMVGFVGLLVPHVLRRLLGPDQRLLLPASILAGAAFLVAADLAVRLLFPVTGTELPVGVLTALLGGPFFLFQLRRGGLPGVPGR